MDISEIFLSKSEFKLLKAISKNPVSNLDTVSDHLFQMGLIDSDFVAQTLDGNSIGGNVFSISESGMRYLSMKEEKRRDFIKSIFSNFFVGVAVGAVGTLITVWITGHLQF